MTDSKGRPTPKRHESQRRRTGPVAPPPTNRKEAARRLREQGGTRRQAGSERAMLARDAGPVRRRVRDIVDGRRNLGVLLLPVALLLLLGRASGSRPVEFATYVLWIATIGAVALDLVGTGLRIRKEVRQQFPAETGTGSHVRYGLLRTTVIRRLRQPAPSGPRGSL